LERKGPSADGSSIDGAVKGENSFLVDEQEIALTLEELHKLEGVMETPCPV